MEQRRGTSLEDSFNKKVLALGRVFVNQLAILAKVALMHDLKNEAVTKAAETIIVTIGSFFEERRSFSLTLIGEYFYIEDERIKYNVEDLSNFDLLLGEFRKRKVGAVNFVPGSTAEDFLKFISIFHSADLKAEDVFMDFARRLSEAGVNGLSIEEWRPPKADDGFEKVIDPVKAATRAYIRVLLRIKELFEATDKGQPADIRKLKRAVQSMIDSAYKGEETLLRLSAIRRPEDVLLRHYTNVCVLSLLLGKRLGLSKYQMARLGLAALLHDIGRHGFPDDIVEKLESDHEAVNLMNRHPRLGVQSILRLKGLNEVAVSAMIVAYEHHRNMDGTGFPAIVEPKEMSLFSKIVRVADDYDYSTSSGVYGITPMPPARVIELMKRRSGLYDPDLLDKFCGVMGDYPVGSLLLISDGSLAVALSPGSGPEGLFRPRVAFIDASGVTGKADLSEAAADRTTRSVVKALDAAQARVNVYKYLV
ncbi:MAG TPA: HD domain-containing phosphohydrolase [Nitrospirota bacterium]|jgi:HD-GYP domain-containing protein (c-di-GMP phosphodiesterase class II)